MNTTNDYTDVWIALVEVRTNGPHTDLGDVAGAYVNVVVKSSDAASVREQIEVACAGLGLCVEDVEDLEPVVERRERFVMPSAMLDLACVTATDGQLRFGTFHAFRETKTTRNETGPEKSAI
jgi:hypothetical protein